MSRYGRKVVKEVVRMRQNDWAHPFFAVVVGRIIDPNRTERRVEGPFAGTGEQPNATIPVASNAAKIIISVCRACLCFLPRAARGHLRFRTIDRQVGWAATLPGTGQRTNERTRRL